MRFSNYFLPTLRETPKEAEIISHRLMLRSGMIQQVTSGIYAWLPLGLKVLRKIEHIVRQEQDRAGCIELLAPTLQPATLWHKSGRYDDYGKEMLRILDRHKRELIYGPTAEEVFTDIFSTHIRSYKELPKRLYNIQWKFRDEIRPRFGVMRGREFLMKDAYSFDLTKEAAQASYRALFASYLRTFSRMGLKVIPVRASTGPIGGDLSHEFHIVLETGESTLFYDQALSHHTATCLEDFQGIYAVADDQHNPESFPLPKERLQTSRGIEIGHVFYLGTKYSEVLGASITDSNGQRMPVEMGCYGIGVSRLVGALIEVFHDERGICWPASVAPFQIGLIALGSDQTDGAEAFYQTLQQKGFDVLYHDTPDSAGEKFSDLDLIGCPFQVILGQRTSCDIEIKERVTQKTHTLSFEEGLNFLQEALC